jgi:hypothetical protein
VGDEILFAETVREALHAGANILLECDPRLVSLFARSWPQVEVHARETPPPPRLMKDDIAYQAPSGDLARWYRPTTRDFPTTPGYLTPDPDRVAHWQTWLAGLGEGLRVGISWRSMHRNADRSSYYTELAQWGDILQVPGVIFVNLQYGECADEVADAERLFGVRIHRAPGLNLKDNLDDAAALTKALDLAIAPNSSVFAMAGAVGTPCWLLNLDNDWTMLGTDHVPWFPTVKVYQKNWLVEWRPLLAKLADELRVLARQKGNET